MVKNGARMREFAEAYASSRARMGLPSVSGEDVVYARAVEIVAGRMRQVELLTGRDVTAAVRSTKAEVRRVERQRQFDGLVKAILAQVHRNGERYRGDAELENRVRALEGKQNVALISLVVQIAMRDVDGLASVGRLSIDDARMAMRAARLQIAASLSSHSDAVGKLESTEQSRAAFPGRPLRR